MAEGTAKFHSNPNGHRGCCGCCLQVRRAEPAMSGAHVRTLNYEITHTLSLPTLNLSNYYCAICHVFDEAISMHYCTKRCLAVCRGQDSYSILKALRWRCPKICRGETVDNDCTEDAPSWQAQLALCIQISTRKQRSNRRH